MKTIGHRSFIHQEQKSLAEEIMHKDSIERLNFTEQHKKK